MQTHLGQQSTRLKISVASNRTKMAKLIIFLFISLLAFCLVYACTHTEQVFARNPNMRDEHNRIVMGQASTECDDGMTSLETDWDGSYINYTCLHPKARYPVDERVDFLLQCDPIPDNYSPEHYCMQDKVEYTKLLPTHEGHRPLWAMFGEYRFLPPQRWLHNIEHGAVVLLYHPCANPYMIGFVRDIVRGCIRKHVIAADAYRTSKTRPFALITWGCRLTFNTFKEADLVEHIRAYALKGPEGKYPKEGQYNVSLVSLAKVPDGSTYDDAHLCPGHDRHFQRMM